MKLKYICFFVLIGILGCSKEEYKENENDSTSNQVERFEVTIDLPNNSSFQFNELSIATPFQSINLDSGTASIKSPQVTYYTSFVSTNEQIVLMGYHGPGSEGTTIDCNSTLLSLVMGSMSLFSFPIDMKKELIPIILEKPSFVVLSNYMQTRLENGSLPIEESNPEFTNLYHQLLASLFSDEQISNKIARSLSDNPPLEYRTINNQVTLVNPGFSFATVVGLYKDGNKIGLDKILGGVNFVPTNLGSILSQGSSAIGFTDLPIALNDVEESFTFQSDGIYELRVRTGCPKDFESLQNDEEALNALRENLASWAYTILLEIIPWDELIENGLQISNFAQCLLGIIPEVVEGYGNLSNLEPGITAADMFGVCMNIVGEVIGISLTLAENCLAFVEGSGSSYTDSLDRFTRILGRIGLIGNTLNLGVGLGQWFYKDARIDLCFNVEGGVLNECEEDQAQIFREIQDFSDRSLVFTRMNRAVTIVNTVSDGDIGGNAVFDNEGNIISIDLKELGLTGLPARFSELSKLQSISIEGNPLVGFPNQINAPETLEFVRIIHTCNNDYYVFPEISNLPTTFLERHSKIKVFALAGTISSIPLELALHPSLENIGVESLGSFVPVPPEICDSGIFVSTRSWSETISSKKGSKSDCLLEEIGNDRCDD
ncbi:hypothetical protein [Croceivirga thetidis]|uniref:Receptor L-domain domain-containing protein n=1 Tax=Croceivirga thetidis TaxID=2721623 RepID=A0ABX1GUG6_9FLAO|nr:hypothetical protein [Croceivirga thetidis]NKI32696.1 hypothetical protein [Croceivirga thetidis]